MENNSLEVDGNSFPDVGFGFHFTFSAQIQECCPLLLLFFREAKINTHSTTDIGLDTFSVDFIFNPAMREYVALDI
jgi:hypothetical protein